jgi:UDP-N-acetylglucosamine 2-epimerase
LISSLADLHFAPTGGAQENLRREGVAAEAIEVTGNTVIDALHWALAQPFSLAPPLADLFAHENMKRVLVTIHRRENHGVSLRAVCRALKELVQAVPEAEILFPVHLSPRVRQDVMPLLAGTSRIHLLPPLDYLTFVQVMRRVHLVVTDSGGIQEEAPSLGIPVLVAREVTERPEAVRAGGTKLVGGDYASLVAEARRLLAANPPAAASPVRASPYGDGRASELIVARVARYFGLSLPQLAEPVTFRLAA